MIIITCQPLEELVVHLGERMLQNSGELDGTTEAARVRICTIVIILLFQMRLMVQPPPSDGLLPSYPASKGCTISYGWLTFYRAFLSVRLLADIIRKDFVEVFAEILGGHLSAMAVEHTCLESLVQSSTSCFTAFETWTFPRSSPCLIYEGLRPHRHTGSRSELWARHQGSLACRPCKLSGRIQGSTLL